MSLIEEDLNIIQSIPLSIYKLYNYFIYRENLIFYYSILYIIFFKVLILSYLISYILKELIYKYYSFNSYNLITYRKHQLNNDYILNLHIKYNNISTLYKQSTVHYSII